MTPAFILSAALLDCTPEVQAWANVPRRRAIYEAFAALVADRDTSLPPHELRAAVRREVETGHAFERDEHSTTKEVSHEDP